MISSKLNLLNEIKLCFHVKMNYTFIRKMGDFFLLNSLQAQVNNLNNQNDKKRKVSKRYQEIFDRGCLFLDGSTTHPVKKSFQDVLKIHSSSFESI